MDCGKIEGISAETVEAFGSPESPMYNQRIWHEIINRLIWLLPDDVGLEESEDKTCLTHLHWMLVNALYMTDAGKRNRWLGYVQGIMAMRGLLDVNEERERTRPLFTALLASGEVVLRNTQECADCHAVFSIGPKDIVCRDCARKEPVLQKVGFTCERTQERHTYTDMADFIMAFLTVKKERDEAKEREIVLRKDVEELVEACADMKMAIFNADGGSEKFNKALSAVKEKAHA